jgi:hypothetical protein
MNGRGKWDNAVSGSDARKRCEVFLDPKGLVDNLFEERQRVQLVAECQQTALKYPTSQAQ